MASEEPVGDKMQLGDKAEEDLELKQDFEEAMEGMLAEYLRCMLN